MSAKHFWLINVINARQGNFLGGGLRRVCFWKVCFCFLKVCVWNQIAQLETKRVIIIGTEVKLGVYAGSL